MSRIIVLSTFLNVGGNAGDGYTNYIVPYLNGLVNDGHLVMAFGLAYNRQQTNWHFGVNNVSVKNAAAVIATLVANLEVDRILIALDIPHVVQLHEQFQKMKHFCNGKKPEFWGVSAVEADPIPTGVGIKLMLLDGFIAISEFGEKELRKVGVDAVHVPALVDLNTFKPKTLEGMLQSKKTMGFENSTIFFVNADGNERKNIALVFEALGLVKDVHPNIRLLLLTRKSSPIAWDYEDLSKRFGLVNKVTILDRTLSRQEVADLYRMSDFHVNMSKAAGLDLSILESQACKTPVIAGNWCGMAENITDGKGIPLDSEFRMIDVFLNGNRYFVTAQTLADKIIEYMNPDKADELKSIVDKAYEALIQRTNSNPYSKFVEALHV